LAVYVIVIDYRTKEKLTVFAVNCVHGMSDHIKTVKTVT